MSEFDEWYEKETLNGWVDKEWMMIAFEAGAQSRQAEIDKLKQALKTSLAAHECVCLERDELQKRIDEALRFYNEAKSPHNIGMIQMAILLKGKKDES